ncbi:PREDICTED: probable indole-3-acetic acid-amido synthetase GH3.6 [Ipomoea nil]|uniref:probable indole-3-acetic acid-amido synthetase GH3.6 n=1 Tax=Ipomoea nil TaxID=35883 RepID=UPI0009010EFC|nr:PREDICTED: probable indole-3-acetic acid-amido synthetase GH3.6 [Ipomoea nil]
MTAGGGEIIKKLEDTTRDAARHQSETLRYILQHNGGVSYLRRYLGSYNEPVDADTFRSAVPLSRYEDYADYINKMADGVLADENDGGRPLLSVDPLTCFFYSSGTSSMKPKLIPYFDSKPAKEISAMAHQGSFANVGRLFPPRPSANKALWFLYAGNVAETKGGYKAMAATSSPLHNDPKGSSSSRLLSACVSPREVILGTDVEQQMYCHLLCGLRNSDLIHSIRAPYASGLARAFRLLEAKWERICEDLENGFPAAEIITDAVMRESVSEILSGPRPDLSNKFRAILREKSWEGIVRKLWPNVGYVRCITTGTMFQYYEKLRFYARDVPILGGDYFSSECSIALNFDVLQPPELTRYTMIPSAAYFEFLPFDMDRCCCSGSRTLDLSSVRVGEFYELIVTTYRGFYRYRLGDIVKVVGHYNSSPQVEFVMRAPKTSGDIVTERDLMSAMGGFRVVARDVMLSAEVTDFTSFFDLEAEPNRLKIFLELKDGCAQSEVEMIRTKLRKCCSRLEDDLGGIYKVMKARGEVSSLLVSIVQPGSFDSLLEMAVEKGVPATQYKPPKILRDCKLVEFLEMSAILTITADS